MAEAFEFATTRGEVLARDGFRCWLCLNQNPAGLHLAHQISRNTPERFAYYSSLGVLAPSIDYPDHPDNLITLCGICHPSYDAGHPYWVMVPDSATLARYISHERMDYRSRVLAAKQGRYQERTLPVVNRALVKYHPCILEPEMARGLERTNVKVTDWPMAWLGDPVAALVKAAAGLCQPCKEDAVMHTIYEDITLGVPKELKRKSLQLLDLWCRRDPRIEQPTPPP